MVKIFHLVKIHFDRRTPAITQEWLDRRYAFFAEHTLKSLEAQRFQDFGLWFCCVEGMEGCVQKLKNLLPAICKRRRAYFTFPSSPKPKQEQHLTYAANFLPEDVQRMRQCDYVCVTRIDSDDLYSSDAMQIVHDTMPLEFGRVESSIFARGYMHDLRTGEVGVYLNPSSPFHTLMIPMPVFMNEEAYNKLDIGDHSVVRSRWPCQVLPSWKFTVLVHGNNFLSTMDYGSEPKRWVERNWSVERFLDQPVTFDVDDFCDKWNCLADLDELKRVYPRFQATLFTIPALTSQSLLREARRREWLELAVHGIKHEPNEEMRYTRGDTLLAYLKTLDYSLYVKGFRCPAWFIGEHVYEACNRAGLWIALHVKDSSDRWKCEHGYYVCDDKPYWHGHTHDVCGNWLHGHLEELKLIWPKDQAFSKVSDSVLVPQSRAGRTA